MGILLIQPRHVYAPSSSEETIGHVYMPTSLLTAAARLQLAGVDLRVVDENIEVATSLPTLLGVNVIGPPYVSSALDILGRLKAQHPNGTMILGGQGITGFSDAQRMRLWGPSVVDGNNDADLESCLRLQPSSLPPAENTSLISAYEMIPDDIMRQYLSVECGFYLSQGCRFRCTFCAAERTRFDPRLGSLNRMGERYRSLTVVIEDLDYLVQRARRLGLQELSLYLSNLDLFQSPSSLAGFAQGVAALRRRNLGFEIRMRALATTTSFLSLHKASPNTISDLVSAGLYRVGFGIDGATKEVWSAIKKPQESISCLDAIRIARTEYGIEPEALMVFGHNCADDGSSLRLAVDILRDLKLRYGAIPRPHVAKAIVPGNDGWSDPSNAVTVDYLTTHPGAFQMLDFTALPSWLTHPDAEFRELVSSAFIAACAIEGSRTQYVYPEDPEGSSEDREAAQRFNLRRYDI